MDVVKSKDYMYDYIDQSGKEVVPRNYHNAEPFSEGLAHVALYGKEGFIDK